MPLKVSYSEAGEIPEAIASLYTEGPDGRFVLDIEDVDSHPKVRGVINANKENARKAQERLAKLTELEGRLAALPEDFDADEWTRIKSGAKPDEQLNAMREQHSRAIEALKAKHAADLGVINGHLAERDNYIDGQTRRDALNAALDAAGFDPAHKPLLATYLADKVQVRREDNGQRVAFVNTDLGELAPADFVKEFAAKEGAAYLAKPSGPGAAGSRNARTGVVTVTRAEFAKLTPEAQAKTDWSKTQLVD